MKIIYPRTIILAALLTLISSTAYGDDVRAKLIEERDDVLSQILAYHERRESVGAGSEKDVTVAKLALYSFRRDTARELAKKIEYQSLIITIHEENLNTIKRKKDSGLADVVDVWTARDQLLQSKILLEEFKSEARTS